MIFFLPLIDRFTEWTFIINFLFGIVNISDTSANLRLSSFYFHFLCLAAMCFLIIAGIMIYCHNYYNTDTETSWPVIFIVSNTKVRLTLFPPFIQLQQ